MMLKNIFIFYFAVFSLIFFGSCKNNTKITPTPTTPVSPAANVFVGTYTHQEGHVNGKATGIYLFYKNLIINTLDSINVEKNVINPSYIALAASGKYLYAVEEISADKGTSGQVTAFELQEDKALKMLNKTPSQGFAPCHISVDKQNRYAFVVNYVGSNIVMLPIDKDGSFKMVCDEKKLVGKGKTPRQEAPHPHCAVLSPEEQFLYVCDLGTDQIYSYKIDYEKGKLLPTAQVAAKITAGAGPRHITFHPTLPYAYVINELNNSISVFSFLEKTGELKAIQNISTLPADFQGNNNCAAVHISTDGKFLYGSNRGHNTLVGYNIKAENGTLTLIGHTPTHGEVPRDFAITHDNKQILCANQNSDNIVIFNIEANGNLTFQKEEKVKTPVCVIVR